MQPSSSTVRRVSTGESDAQIVKALREQALRSSPREFDTDDDPAGDDAVNWGLWIGRGATFVLEHEGRPVGLVAGVRHHEDRIAAFLEALWVHPRHRGSGGADLLVEAVLDWCREQESGQRVGEGSGVEVVGAYFQNR